MKPLLLSIADLGGGAARAAYRLHQSLHNINIPAQMLVQAKSSDDRTVIAPATKLEKGFSNFRYALDSLPLRFYAQRQDTVFSCEWLPDFITSKVIRINPDIINLHWVCNGYFQIETLANLHRPIIWTLHDMWAFTGGCHYNQDCDRYTQTCGACPQLGSSRDRDLSHWIWHRKAKAWRGLNPVIVTPSQWLAKCARSSTLFKNLRVEVIPNSLDIQRYRPIDQKLARQLLNLPLDKSLILFGAIRATHDRRKGFHLLQTALQKLSQNGWQDKAELVVMGASQPDDSTNLGFQSRYLGKLSDDISLALLYAAADVFVAPSVQDNLPNTVLEAIACGTPCVAFDIGGMPDLIEHQKNGYLAPPYEIEAFAQGIAWVLEDEERRQALSRYARAKVEQEFTLELQANRYLVLFEEVLALDRAGKA